LADRRQVVISNGGIGTFQSCKRKYDLRNNRSLEQIEKPEYFAIGSAFHTGIEKLRDGESLKVAVDASKVGLDADNQIKVAAMVESWRTFTREFYEEYEIIEVEKEFLTKHTSNMHTDYFFGGIVDALARDRSGRIFILENKTTSDTLDRFCSRLWSTRQGLLYNWALTRLGIPIAGIIYDVIRKPTLKRQLATPEHKRRYKKATKDGVVELYAGQREYDEIAGSYHDRLMRMYREKSFDSFRCEVIVHTPAQIAELDKDLDEIMDEYVATEARSKWPRSLGSCSSFNRMCEFSPYCSAGSDEVILQTLFKKRKRVFEDISTKTEEKV
jgi:hypothetical protein